MTTCHPAVSLSAPHCYRQMRIREMETVSLMLLSLHHHCWHRGKVGKMGDGGGEGKRNNSPTHCVVALLSLPDVVMISGLELMKLSQV